MYYLTEHTQELQKVGLSNIFSSHTGTLGHRKVPQLVHKHKPVELLVRHEPKLSEPTAFFSTSLKADSYLNNKEGS